VSADNYLLIRKHTDGKFYVSQEFASCDPRSIESGLKKERFCFWGPFDKREQARDFAFDEVQRDYYEYGVSEE